VAAGGCDAAADGEPCDGEAPAEAPPAAE